MQRKGAHAVVPLLFRPSSAFFCIRPRIPVVESAADFVETPVPLGRVFGGGADSCIRGGDIAHC
jgi:hypothetical protein